MIDKIDSGGSFKSPLQLHDDASECASDLIHVVEMVGDDLRHHPAIVFLSGDIGSGKTYFVQNLMRYLGCVDRVHSPSYLYLNQYHTNGRDYFHIDCDRIRDQLWMIEDILLDYEVNRDTLLAEWPEPALSSSYQPDWWLTFDREAGYKVSVKKKR